MPRLKKNKTNKSERFIFRCTEEEKNQIMRKALLYTEGNVSEYILFAAKEFVPDKDDFEKEEELPKPKRRNKKGGK